MNELLFWGLVGISSLQVTSNLSQPSNIFNYQMPKMYSVFPIGIPNAEKTRNKNQIFVLGEKNPFWGRSKDVLTFAGPITLVVCATNPHLALQDIEEKTKNMYNLQMKFSETPTIIICDPRERTKQNLYYKLQDEQLKREYEWRQEQKQIRACVALSCM